MTTLILSGNRGLEDIDVSGHNLYDARTMTCNVWQGTKNTGVNIDPREGGLGARRRLRSLRRGPSVL